MVHLLALNIFKIRKFQLLKIETLVPIYNIHWVKLKKKPHTHNIKTFFSYEPATLYI